MNNAQKAIIYKSLGLIFRFTISEKMTDQIIIYTLKQWMKIYIEKAATLLHI